MFQVRGRSSKSWLQKVQALIFCSLFVSYPSLAAPAYKCHDGDTCKIENKKVRISGIDAPEIDQPYGEKSRRFLVDFLDGKKLNLQCNGKSYDRSVCLITANGEDVGEAMVKNGFAFDYPQYSQGRYKAFQEEARRQKLGLWQQEKMISPFCWRWTGTEDCEKNPEYQP
jgi:micrococcal nuclease